MGDNGVKSPADTGFGDTYWIWYQTLQPYYRSFQVAVCPSGDGRYDKTPYAGHYGANSLVMLEGRPPAAAPMAAASIQSVATTYLLMDAGPYRIDMSIVRNPTGSFFYTPGGCGPTGGSTNPTYPLSGFNLSDCQNGRHLDGINVAFCDGHVKWLKNTKVQEEANKAAPTLYGAWNPANP